MSKPKETLSSRAGRLIRSTRSRHFAAGSLLLIIALSCSGEHSSTAPTAASARREHHNHGRAPFATAMAALSGDGQQGIVGRELATPLVVRVVNITGNPLSGQTVRFTVVRGGGSVTAESDTSNDEGLVRARWTIGTKTDSQTVEASVPVGPRENSTMTVGFHAKAVPDAPSAIRVVSGDAQHGAIGAALAMPIVAQLVDRYANGIPGQPLTFTVAVGRGSVDPTSATTDSVGRAQASWVLGARVDTVQVVTVESGALPVARFTATPMLPSTATVLEAGGDGQSAMAGTPLRDSLVVRVQLESGQPVEGVDVSWSTTAGTMMPAQSRTDVTGSARTSWVVGDTPGIATATATVNGLAAATFTATVSAPPRSTLTLAADPTPPFVVAKATDVAVVLRDANGVPVSGGTVTWTIASGNGGSFSDIGYVGAKAVTTTTTLTDANGTTGVRWYLDTLVGPSALDVRAPNADPLTVSVTATPDQTCESGISGGTERNNYIGSGMVGTILPTVLTPYSYDRWGNTTNAVPDLPRVPDGGAAIRMDDGTLRIRLGTRAGSVQMLYYWWYCERSYARPFPRLQNNAFTATATPGPASTIAISGGNGQNGFAGTELSAPLTVSAADQYGNSTAGGITWAATSGGGSVASSGPSARWTLGTTAGVQHATATLDNGASVSFYATAIAAGSTLTVVSGDGQTAVAGAELPNALVVQVTDANGNPTSGVPITWSITAGGGTIYGPGTTDASGRSWARWMIGSTPGTNATTASVSGTPLTVNFTATGR